MFRKKKKYNTLRITNKIISYGGQVWQLQNITRVGKYKTKRKYPIKFRKIISTTLLFGVGIFLLNNDLPIGMWIIVSSGSYLTYQLFRNFFFKQKYILKIEASSGGAELFESKDEDFIDRLVVEISEAITAEEKKELTVNIDSRTIYDNIHNSTIVNDSEISNSFNNRFKILE